MGHLVRKLPNVWYALGEPAYIDVDPNAINEEATPKRNDTANATSLETLQSRELDNEQSHSEQSNMISSTLSCEDLEKFHDIDAANESRLRSMLPESFNTLDLSYDWPIEKKRLNTDNKQIVSPQFPQSNIRAGDRNENKFTITIIPKVSDKGQMPRSLKKSKGSIGIRLKCESGGPHLRFRFRFLINGQASEPQEHDFYNQAMCEVSYVWKGLGESNNIISVRLEAVKIHEFDEAK